MPVNESARVTLLKRLLRPAVRFCVEHSITAQELLESVKHVLVEVAAEHIGQNESKITVSRISVLSGLHRRDVNRIFRNKETKPVEQLNLAARVLLQWEQDSRFLTSQKKPKVLGYKGPKAEFKRLVESVNKDVNPATIMFELERIGAVERVENNARIIQAHYLSIEQPEKGYELLAKNLGTLVQAAEENISCPQEIRNLNLRTEFDNISIKDIDKIRKWLFEHGVSFHKRARDFLSRYDIDITPDSARQGGGRVVLTAFSWTQGGT